MLVIKCEKTETPAAAAHFRHSLTQSMGGHRARPPRLRLQRIITLGPLNPLPRLPASPRRLPGTQFFFIMKAIFICSSLPSSPSSRETGRACDALSFSCILIFSSLPSLLPLSSSPPFLLSSFPPFLLSFSRSSLRSHARAYSATLLFFGASDFVRKEYDLALKLKKNKAFNAQDEFN